MTLAAESFVGRVLAVFSRRSPGFRPPLARSGPSARPGSSAVSPPAPTPDAPGSGAPPRAGTDWDDVTGPSVAGATARWKSVSPHKRLQRRAALLELTAVLDNAKTCALDLSYDVRDVVYVRDLARVLAVDLGKACDNLADAADNFGGADMTAVDPARIDLAGIRWDNDARWPSPERAESKTRARAPALATTVPRAASSPTIKAWWVTLTSARSW